MKERKSGLRNESSKTKRARIFHRNTAAYIYKKIIKKKKKKRITAAFAFLLIIIYKKVSSTFQPNLSLSYYYKIFK